RRGSACAKSSDLCRSPGRYCPREYRMPPWLRPDDAATGRVCAPVVPSVNTFAAPFATDFRKRPAVLFAPRGFAREGLPAQRRNIDVRGMNFEREAGAAGHLGSDNGGASPAERLVDGLP